MTILFIYNNALNPEVGGTERATKLVMDELERRGHKAIGILHSSRETPDRFFLNGTPIESLSGFLSENNVDVVVNQIAFHYWLLESFLDNGGRQWKNKGGRIISFMHLDPTPEPSKKIRLYFEDWQNKSTWGKLKRLLLIGYLPFLNHKIRVIYRHSLRFLYDQSDRYVLLSKSFKEVFVKLSRLSDTSKLRYITNMLTFDEIESADLIPKKEKSVIVVARLDDEQKNISFIIDVWNSIIDHHGYTLHIIGEGKDRDKLLLKSAGVKDIVFEGHQSPRKWYRNARISLMASPREGWGLTITESLQNGVVPIVLNTSSVFKDIIDNGSNGYLIDSKSEYIDKLELLLTNDGLRDKMAEKALDSATRYLPSTVGGKWDYILSELK